MVISYRIRSALPAFSRRAGRSLQAGLALFASSLLSGVASAEPAGILCRFRDVVSTTDAVIPSGRTRLHQGVLFNAGFGGIVAFDVSDPDQPAELGRWMAPGFVGDFEFVGDRMYATADDVGLVVLDWSHPANPAVTATLPYNGYVRGLHAEPGMLLLGRTGGLFRDRHHRSG